jgi:hypothetical protein
MMRPHHRFVDFVEANKEKLDGEELLQHPEYTSKHVRLVAAGQRPTLSHEVAELLQPGRRCWFLARNPSPEAMQLLQACPELIYWPWLSRNPAPEAIAMLRANPSKICWHNMSYNTSAEAMCMLEQNLNKANSIALSTNSSPAAVTLLTAHPELVSWWGLAANPCAGSLIKTRPDRQFGAEIAMNPSPEAIKLWPQVCYMVRSWEYLSRNPAPAAMSLLAANPEKVDMLQLSYNPSPQAGSLLQANSKSIFWAALSSNRGPCTIPLLEQHPEKAHWRNLSSNPVIFKLDCDAMTRQMAPLREELLRYCMHPTRLYQAEHHWLLFN